MATHLTRYWALHMYSVRGRERRRREEGKEGGRERGRKGGRVEGREKGRKGERKGGRERERKGERDARERIQFEVEETTPSMVYTLLCHYITQSQQKPWQEE